MSTLSLNEIKEQLSAKNFAQIPIDIERGHIDAAVQSLMAYLQLPDEQKTRFSYRLLPQDRGSEVGYNFRARKLGFSDDREYFHYHPHAEIAFADGRKEEPLLHDVLSAMSEIYSASINAAKHVIGAFEEEFPGITNRFFSPNEIPKCYLRLVAYKQLEPGDFLAAGHYDRGSCTIAIAESSDGLRIGTTPETVQPVAHQIGRAFFFPGVRFPEVTNEAYKPAWHDVIQKEGDAFSETHTRWALVFFIDAQEMSEITWEQAHTPLY